MHANIDEYESLNESCLYEKMHIVSTLRHYCMQISMNVRQAMYVLSMQTVMILMAATGVSVGQDSWEMDTTAQVDLYFYRKWYKIIVIGSSVSKPHPVMLCCLLPIPISVLTRSTHYAQI